MFDLNSFSVIKNLFFSFFYLKFLFFFNIFFYVSFSFKGFYILGFYYYYLKSFLFQGILSFDNIEYYKLKFKFIIKLNGLRDIFFSLKLINKEIFNFFCYYNFCDSFSRVFLSLDLFLYKIFWKLVKKIHPRRPNTWIYLKYWKYVEGIWNFFLLDSYSSLPLYMFFNFLFYLKLYCLPSAFFPLIFCNELKLGRIWLLKYSFVLTGVLKLLWKKQFGKCFFCSFYFELVSFYFPKVLFLRGSFLKNDVFGNVVLVHYYCI